MAKKPTKKAAPEKPTNPRKKGFRPVVVRLAPEQIDALKAEARRRRDALGGIYDDVSELVREAIDKVWMKRK